MFPHNFSVDRAVTNLLATNRCNGIWEMTRHSSRNGLFARTNLLQTCCGLVIYVADLLRGSRQLVTDLLRGNWCNGYWPLISLTDKGLILLLTP